MGNKGIMAFLMVFSCASIAVASDGDANAVAGWLGSVDMMGLLKGAGAGVLAALLGWMKNRDPETGEGEEWEWKHALPAVVVGAAVGVYAEWGNKSLLDAAVVMESGVFIIGMEAVSKLLFRNTPVAIREILGYIKLGWGSNSIAKKK